MDNKAQLSVLSSWATILMCAMTFVTFMYTTGTWETPTYETRFEETSILGYDGTWGENIVVTYTDGTTETIKSITNNYWTTMSINNEGSNPIVLVEYVLDVKIPVSDTFSTQNYFCDISITHNNAIIVDDYFSTMDIIDVPADVWTRIITIPLDVVPSSNTLDGEYTVSFENHGTIEGVSVPTGLSLDALVTDGVTTFLL